jgi:glucose/arabinose dehydrogenase
MRLPGLSARALQMKDVVSGRWVRIVGHRDMQGAQWEGGREIWWILNERNDVGNSKVGQLGHVTGSHKTS